VQVLNMGAQQIFERVRAESENTQADIWWGGTQQQFSLATAEGLLMEITPAPAFIERIPEEYRPETNTWFPEILLPEVIMYNTDMLTPEEAPQDWDDLIDPMWDDQIIIRAVLPSGTMRTIYSAMIARYWEEDQSPDRGYEFLRQLDANTKEYAADPTSLYLSLARQEGSVSLWNLQDILIQRERQNMPFGYVIAESGVPILTDGVAVIQNARHPQAAQRFLEFLFDDTIRAELAEQFFQIPVTPLDPANQPAWLQELELVPMDLPWDVMAEMEQEWMQYWDQNIHGQGGQ
jgi:iron(III) transport system substrate-binding protein